MSFNIKQLTKVPKIAIIPAAALVWWNIKGVQWYMQRKRGYENYSQPLPLSRDESLAIRQRCAENYYRNKKMSTNS